MSALLGFIVGYALRHFAHDWVMAKYQKFVDLLNKRNIDHS